MAPFALAQDKPPLTAKQSPREIIAAVPKSWPPQYSVDESGKPIGFAIDVMEKIAARAGVRVKYMVLDAFADASEAMRKGKVHIIPNSGITADRATKYFFTEPVETFVVSIFVRRDTTDIKGLEDLMGRRVAVVERNISEKLLKPRKDIKSVVHRDAVTALFDLLSGNVDALVFPEPVMLNLARKVGVEDRIKMAGEPLKELKRAIRVQKSEPELFAALNTAVKSFVGTPEYQSIYLKWYGKPIPFWTVARVAWAMGGVMAFIVASLLLWRYRTGVRLNRALAESEARFKDIAEAATDRFWEMDENLVFTANIEYHNKDVFLPQRHFIGRTRWDAAGADLEREEKWRRHREDLLAHSPFRDFQYSVTDEDGKIHHLSVSGMPIFDNAGVFKGYRGSATGITERKQVEEALMKSEFLFRTTIDHLPIGLNVKDPDGRYLLVNDTMADRYGLRKEDFIGKDNEELFPEAKESNEASLAQELELIKTRKVTRRVQEKRFQDGTLHTLLIDKFPIFDDEGNVASIGVTGIDITEQKAAEQASQKSEQRLRGAIESLQEGFALFDADDRLVAVNDVFRQINPKAQKFLNDGGTFEDVLRANVAQQRMMEGIGREEDFIRERIEQHRNPEGPIIRQYNDGKWFILKEVRTPEGGVALTFIDITELKQAEEARNKALVDAEQANQAKSEFLAAMSHDLRTPLNAILGFADILTNQYFGPISNKYREYADDIHSSGEHLLTLVNDILDLSTIEAGKQSLVKEELSILEVVSECERIIEEKARSLGIDLICKVSKDLPPLYADRRAAKQILLNLLSNAVKFTPQGGKITLSAKASIKNTTLEITDTGKGIPAEKLPKLTDPFTRVDTDPYLAEPGWGLGLSITKSLVDLHDGTLDIKSRVGKGTTVTVTLPNVA